MKLSDLDQVEDLVAKRDRLQLLIAELDFYLKIHVRGDLDDDGLVCLVRPVLERELTARVAQCNAKLEQLGVELA